MTPRPRRGWRLAAAIFAALCVCLASPARAVDVSQLSDFEADPCVMTLGERNTAQHVDAPDSELVDACERAHGSVEVAWDFLTRTWLPRDVTATTTYGAAAPLGLGVTGLALLEMLLAYAVLGMPVWALAAALWSADGMARRPRRLAAQTLLGLVARLLLGTLLLRLLALPGATVVAAVALVAAIAWRVRHTSQPPSGAVADGPACSAFAEILAGVVNDTASAAPGLLALALASRGHWRLLALGVVMSLLVSLPAVLRGLRVLRRTAIVLAAAGALLALGVGSIALSDPTLARTVAFGQPVAGYLIPILLAVIVLWRARLLDRPFSGRRPFPGR